MIRVNLLPEHLRPIRRTPLPYIASILVLILAVLAMGSVFMKNQTELGNLQSSLASEKQALAALEPIVEEANGLTEQKLALQTKISVIQEILNNRIVWSKQLNRLAELTPENVWFRQVRVAHEPRTEEVVEINPETQQPVMDPRTGRIKTKRQSVRKPILQVSGYVVQNEEGQSEVFPLTESTANDPEFSRTFSLEGPIIEPTEYSGFRVRGFTLPYLITPGGTN